MHNSTLFPAQKISSSSKNDSWHKKHLDFCDGFIARNNINTEFYRNMQENYDLRANKLDISNYTRYINPSEMNLDTFPAEFKHIGIGNAKINLLIGDYAGREKDFRAYISNKDSIGVGNKSDELKQQLLAKLDQLARSEVKDEEELKARLQKLQEFAKYDFQSVGEKVANAIIKREFTEKNYEMLFTQTFEDLLVSGCPTMYIDILGREPIMKRVDPRNVFTIGPNDSMYLHEQDIIVIVEYLSPGIIHDRYWDKLQSKHTKQMDDASRNLHTHQSAHDDNNHVWVPSMDQTSKEVQYTLLTSKEYESWYDSLTYTNTEGEWRVCSIFWRSKRKIGELTYYDENGVQQKEWVNETVTPDEAKGEEIEWKWINEWRRATRIGKDIDIYYGPVEHSAKSMTNLSYGLPPVIGLRADAQFHKVRSLMDIIKPFDIAYDIGFWKRELEIASYRGPATAINVSMVPDGWEPNEWLRSGMVDKIFWMNPHQEVNKGVNQGKAAGMYNTFITQDVSMGSNAQSIQMFTKYLESIEYTMGKVSGIHGAREGEIGNRSAVRNNQIELQQFTKITEKWFIMDNEFRRICLKKFLEVCKIAYHETPERGMFLLNDMGQEYIQVSKDFAFYEYDIHIPSNKIYTQVFNDMESLSQAALQNGLATLDDLARVTLTESPAEKIHILKESAERMRQQQQESNKAQIEAQERKDQREYQMHKEKLDNEIEIALINAEVKDRDSERKTDSQDLELNKQEHRDKIELEREKVRLEREKLQETRRTNLAKESIARAKSSQQK